MPSEWSSSSGMKGWHLCLLGVAYSHPETPEKNRGAPELPSIPPLLPGEAPGHLLAQSELLGLLVVPWVGPLVSSSCPTPQQGDRCWERGPPPGRMMLVLKNKQDSAQFLSL